MLSIQCINDRTGDDLSANYDYIIYVNMIEIARGRLEGHNRNDGWAALLKAIAERHLTPTEVDLVHFVEHSKEIK